MAKRKKKAEARRSRRRVSGMGSTLTPVLAAVGGAIASKMITKAIGTKLDPKIAAGAQLAAAILLLPKFIKGPMGAGLAMGVAAASGTALLQSVGVISGFYDVPTITGLKRIAGAAKQQLGGSARQVLNGVDLVRDSADVRRVHPANHNFATNANSLSVISGIESELDGAGYNS